MRRIFVLLLGVILAWFGFAGSAAAGADIPSPAVASHRYDPPADTATASIVTTERGPPSAYDPSTSYSAVAPRSLGASACPAGTTSGSTTTYDDIARPVRLVRGDHHRADEQVGRAGTDPVVVDRSDVAANGGDDVVRALSATERRTLDDALRPDKLDHIFDPKHNFDPLVQQFGSREAAMEQIVRSIGGPLPQAGRFEIAQSIGGQPVIIRGAVVDGIPRIGTAFTP